MLYGVDDIICPVALGYKQEDALPKLQFFYVKNCGHQGQTDRPDIFNPVFLELSETARYRARQRIWLVCPSDGLRSPIWSSNK
jgi:hypothetical protein